MSQRYTVLAILLVALLCSSVIASAAETAVATENQTPWEPAGLDEKVYCGEIEGETCNSHSDCYLVIPRCYCYCDSMERECVCPDEPI
jgi:hypothetical protein